MTDHNNLGSEYKTTSRISLTAVRMRVHPLQDHSTVKMIFTSNLNKHESKHSETLHPLISSSSQLPDAGPAAAQAGFHLLHD